jgi:hypothetical protein
MHVYTLASIPALRLLTDVIKRKVYISRSPRQDPSKLKDPSSIYIEMDNYSNKLAVENQERGATLVFAPPSIGGIRVNKQINIRADRSYHVLC